MSLLDLLASSHSSVSLDQENHSLFKPCLLPMTTASGHLRVSPAFLETKLLSFSSTIDFMHVHTYYQHIDCHLRSPRALPECRSCECDLCMCRLYLYITVGWLDDYQHHYYLYSLFLEN